MYVDAMMNNTSQRYYRIDPLLVESIELDKTDDLTFDKLKHAAKKYNLAKAIQFLEDIGCVTSLV